MSNFDVAMHIVQRFLHIMEKRLPTLRLVGPLKRKNCAQSLGRSKMKRDRIMQNLLQEDNGDEILHLKELLKNTEKRIIVMQVDASKRPSAAEVITCYFIC